MSTLGNSILMEYWRQTASTLPAGFRACEYLESTGVQWIDTGIASSISSVAESDFTIAQIANGAIFGAFNWGKTLWCVAGINSNKWYFAISSSVYNTLPATAGRHTLKIDLNEKKYYIDGTGYSCSVADSTNHTNFFLFARMSGKDFSSKCQMHCAKIDSVRNFLPALALAGTTYTDGNSGAQVTASANKPGMYDTVSGRFFTNRGTGADFLYQLA